MSGGVSLGCTLEASGSLRMVHELGPKGREQVKSQGMVQDCEISIEQSKETVLLPDTWCPSRDRKQASRGLDPGALLPWDSEILGSKLFLHLSFFFCKVLLFTQREKCNYCGEAFLLKERPNHHHLGGRTGDCLLPDRV